MTRCNIEAAGKIGCDLIEEVEELELMPVAAVTRADGDSRCDIHGRKQRRTPWRFVVV